MTQVYLDPRGKGTVPSGPNCVCRGESGENLHPELFVSGPQPVARGVARPHARTGIIHILAGHLQARVQGEGVVPMPIC